MTEQENREFLRIERDLRDIVQKAVDRSDDAHDRIDDLIKLSKWLIGGMAGAGIAVALATIPWLWMLSSSTVQMQTTVAQHTEILNQRADYLRRVDTLEAQVALERTRATEDRARTEAIVNEIKNSLRSIEQRLYEGGSMRKRPDRQ